MMRDDIDHVLVTKEQIFVRIKELSADIEKDFGQEPIVMICVLRGSMYFFADLTRELTNFLELEFLSASSYGGGTTSAGEVLIKKDIECSIEGKNVIVVEDIIDTGFTLKKVVEILAKRNPKKLKICALLDKPSRRIVELDGDYIGFTVPNEFVVGYGLDYDQKYRNYPDIGVLKREIYQK